MIWEKDKGWFTTPPFSEHETFDFPEGIGKVDVVNVEHEEVLLVPRWVKAKRVTFKYGLGDQFIGVLNTLHMLGLDKKEKINVKGVQVAPRDVVAAGLPDPAHLGDKMQRQNLRRDLDQRQEKRQPREVYLYQVADNAQCMKRWGCQAVVAQTAFSPVIGWDLIEHGQWKGVGVLGPEAFDPKPFMEKMDEYEFPYGIKEMTCRGCYLGSKEWMSVEGAYPFSFCDMEGTSYVKGIESRTMLSAQRPRKLKRELTLLPLFGLIYFTVCGGSFGAEPMVSLSGPGFALLLLILTPLVFSIPNMLMVREMQSMMPAEGGYYHWLKQAFGPFVGFMGGWMNWVVSWVDVSIYPVLAATYLAFFIPALNDGVTIGGFFISGVCFRSWLRWS